MAISGSNHYMEDARWEVERFLDGQDISRELLSEELIDDMAFHYYKNYYYYEMDDNYALFAAVSGVLKENNIVFDGLEEWIP